MAISKGIRQKVFDKYDGKCGYSGYKLSEGWQIDHITPKCHWRWFQPDEILSCDNIDNLIPAIKIINHYKRGEDLEKFRQYMSTLHLRLAKLPKKTKVPRTVNRIRYLLEVAAYFGITPDKPFNGVFYFETLTQRL